jgi:hypothetical protein
MGARVTRSNIREVTLPRARRGFFDLIARAALGCVPDEVLNAKLVVGVGFGAKSRATPAAAEKSPTPLPPTGPADPFGHAMGREGSAHMGTHGRSKMDSGCHKHTDKSLAAKTAFEVLCAIGPAAYHTTNASPDRRRLAIGEMTQEGF